jgi:hypothetical protein
MAAPPASYEIEPYYSDAEVAKLLDPGGKRIKARSIRSERENGRLVGTRIAGKWMYRKSDVENFLEAARRPTPARGSPSDAPVLINTPKAAAASVTEPAYLPLSMMPKRKGPT